MRRTVKENEVVLSCYKVTQHKYSKKMRKYLYPLRPLVR